MNFQKDISAHFSHLKPLGQERAFNKKPVLYLTVFFFTIAALQTGQDFLHAHLHGYKGYLADSLVFKIYWVLFIPILSFLFYRSAQIKERIHSRLQWLVGMAGVALLSAVHILLVAFLIVVVSSLFFYRPFTFSTPLTYFASEHIYITLFFYASGAAFIFLYKDRKAVEMNTASIASPKLHEQPSDTFADFIPVSVQNKLIPIPAKDVICIQADRPYVKIHTCSGQYLHAATLKDMLTKLGAHRFVRIHRSTIVNTAQVEHIRSRSNGDYDVTLKNGEVVRMSRNYYPAFKELMA
ncbi:LytR/AlgR family response regulator transcription factor [Pontibacter pamirensis]|uniref:LytR/AlgR family response regulator transcription factor n=1 Tax=Pontibacter pamirensis TaxID=2562824 RepID=UPI00138A5622|nr:LytTR family DNA-binding domain-containing protein [Pontibacter pamirensis]